jgi:hypothetical protein
VSATTWMISWPGMGRGNKNPRFDLVTGRQSGQQGDGSCGYVQQAKA